MLKKSIYIKNTIVHIFPYIYLLLIIFCISCKKGINETDDYVWKRNPYLKQLTFNGQIGLPYNIVGSPNFPIFPKNGNLIFYNKTDIDVYQPSPNISGIWKLDTSATFTEPKDSLLINGRFFRYLTISNGGLEIAAIDSLKNNVSGSLYIVNIQNKIKQRVETGLKAVYGIKFMPVDTTLIIYGDGMTSNLPRGYYLFSRYNNKLELLFAEPFGYFGFDISPDGKNLIYPQPSKYSIRELETGTVKTGEVYAEWLAYSPDGKKIAYSDNSLNRYLPSDVGIIDVATGKVTKLDVNLISQKEGGTYASYFSWSYDNSCLVFIATPIVDAKPLGPDNIWLLKLNNSF